MTSSATPDREDARSASTDRASTEHVLDHAAGWISATRERASTLTSLAVAEARLAAISVVLMAFLGVIAAGFLMGAWGLLVAGIIYALLAAGVPAWIALLGMGLVHAGVAVLLWYTVRRLSKHLEFSATRSQMFRAKTETETVH